jgi:nodulation protein E
MAPHRVVVTGIGVISALGPNAASFWRCVSQGQSGIGPIEGADCSRVRFKNGAEVRSFNPEDHFDAKQRPLLDRFAQFAVIAAREAIRDARLEAGHSLWERSAVVTGTAVGGQSTQDDAHTALYLQKRDRITPLTIPRVMTNAGASQISMEFGITGPAYTVSSACASGSHAIGLAFGMVRHGMVDRAVAGGSEAPFSFAFMKAWEAMRVVAPDTCRPFAKDRQGMILGEGGALLLLESLEAAQARDAPIYAEIVGFGMSADAHHVTHPSAEGAARAMRAALADGGQKICPEQIGVINAHGTGTCANDVTEAEAIRGLFGAHADRLAISATKSMHGHALGAAGAMEAIATVLGLQHGIVPPTANFTEPDPRCDLDVVANTPRLLAVEYALSNSFAFGGLNAVLAFRRWET